MLLDVKGGPTSTVFLCQLRWKTIPFWIGFLVVSQDIQSLERFLVGGFSMFWSVPSICLLNCLGASRQVGLFLNKKQHSRRNTTKINLIRIVDSDNSWQSWSEWSNRIRLIRILLGWLAHLWNIPSTRSSRVTTLPSRFPRFEVRAKQTVL